MHLMGNHVRFIQVHASLCFEAQSSLCALLASVIDREKIDAPKLKRKLAPKHESKQRGPEAKNNVSARVYVWRRMGEEHLLVLRAKLRADVFELVGALLAQITRENNV